MSAFRVRSIRGKLAVLIVASVGAAVLVSFAVGSFRELSRFGEAKRAELNAAAHILAASAADAVTRGDRQDAGRALNAIGRIPSVRYAEIRDADGALFAEAGRGVALARGGEEDGHAPTLWSMLRRGSFFAAADIVKGGVNVGRLVVLADASELRQRLAEAMLAAAFSALAAIGVALLVASRLQRAITGPLAELSATMTRVRETNDFSERAEHRSDDETGRLVEAFNDMLGRIETRDAELEEHRTGLERTVAERTHDLATARDAAESANRAKSDFLATMSHEIRTPLNGMLVMAELLSRAELPDRQRRYSEIVVRSGHTLLTIINDILDLSKIEAGKLELEDGRVAPARIVGEVLGLFFERAAAKGLDLAARIAPDVPEVVAGDPVRLGQIVSNLVNNALKFTERGHVLVEVSVAKPEGGELRLLFTVDDTGIGIAADKLGHVFEAFGQADQSTTRRFGGTGLGLSISQRLVNAMGGRIWVESEEGAGSRFSFTMTSRALAEPPLLAVASAAGIRTALIAAPGDATRQVLAGALAEAGCDAVAAEAIHGDIGKGMDLLVIDAAQVTSCAAGLNDGTRIVAVSPLGDASADALVDAGLAAAALTRPVVSTDVARMLVSLSEPRRVAARRRLPSAAELPRLAGLHVLVADDSPVNQEVAREALGTLGATCLVVDDGAKAVEAFRAGSFDVVLMDCSMPVLDGFGATAAIREHQRAANAPPTPIVALTADIAGAAETWRAAGMDDYLSKPFTLKGLADCLTRWAPGERRGETPATLVEAERSEAPAPSSEPPAGTPLDPDVLQSLRDMASGADTILRKALGLFLSHAPARRDALVSALNEGDLARVAVEAHALKSPARNVGARRLADLCHHIEARARADDAALLEEDIGTSLDRELASVLNAAETLLANESPAQTRRARQVA